MTRAGVHRPILSGLLLYSLLLAGCAQTDQVDATDRLKPCTGDDTPVDAYCGSLKVFENRATNQGRQIDLNIVVLPALRADAKPDPLFFLAGGPGQGAAMMAKGVREMFRQVLTDRDIVLVDQRGTGQSHPLNCEDQDDSLKAFGRTAADSLAMLKHCLAGYDADLRLYTTTIAMDDLDDVRSFLGYDQINIYGGSYGTRAGLVYLRQHGDRVRAAILDGVAPTNMRLPLFFPRDVQRALDLLIADCAATAACNATYPNLQARLRELMARLERAPSTVAVVHPRTGERGAITMTARILANILAGTLYIPVASSLIPALIERAEQNDFQGLLALASIGDNGSPSNMSVGMQLSVICAEDAPRITAEEGRKESEGSLFGEYLMRTQQDACAFWPRGTVDAAYYEPVTVTIPTLVMSGELDPVTPPVWGEETARHLPAAKHIVMPGTGHTAGGTGCGLRIIRNFIDAGTTDNLDTSCVANVKRPPFFVTPAGPDPGTGGNLSRRSSTSAKASVDKPVGRPGATR
ncbi:MAG: alpha/beta hydrolase [Acidobacteria bacterium]|nr:alpha/beta hydrolase [Acidobacteriota bacterium]